ncbi:tripartite tricarboxylate transporter substrate-binding protein [Yanshouia hominis]|uniref:Tripartite tricarboxylate transporter substrate binding protein n=1 Tax=Yanshouia hominis TaxID=2763673 RepID=A0ABR7NNC2_9FIRM|nr:tripartite tricarboxylate transporter substrate-binding protein [Yanshouia hominis]MBC8577705.1 hypothetical protein [Yanshouia hominis]
MKKNWLRSAALLMAAVLTVAGTTACSSSGSSAAPAQSSSAPQASSEAAAITSLPSDKLDYIVAAAAGGGLDIVSRCFSDSWAKSLGTTFEYIYEDAGSSYIMGLNDLHDDESDEFSVMCGLAESLPALFAYQNSDYKMEDIAWIGNVYSDANCVMVRADDDRFNSMQDLIDYARTASSPLTISTPQALTPANMTASIFAENAKLNANIVVYEGGSPARKDLIGGQVDISVGGITTAVGIKDQVKVIGIFGASNPVTDIWPDAQTLDQFATNFEMPDMTVHCSVWTSSKMRNEHPEVYDLLVSTFEAAMGNSVSAQNFDTASQTPFIEYIDPETLGVALDEFHQVLVDYDSLLNPQKS